VAFFSAKGPWWLTSSSALHRALTIKRFKGHGLFFHGSDGGCLIRRTAVIRTRMPGGGWGGIARWPPISIDRSEHRGSSVLTHRPCGSLPAVGITVLFAVRPLPSATSASGGSAPPCHERDPLVAAAGRMSRSPAPVLARTGRLPYLWTHVTNEADRGARLHEGLISTARIILLGLVMDSVYQFMMLKMFYPAESVIVALALAFLPYVLLRGPISRTARCGSSKAVTDDVR
jgi:hypothetical protein